MPHGGCSFRGCQRPPLDSFTPILGQSGGKHYTRNTEKRALTRNGVHLCAEHAQEVNLFLTLRLRPQNREAKGSALSLSDLETWGRAQEKEEVDSRWACR